MRHPEFVFVFMGVRACVNVQGCFFFIHFNFRYMYFAISVFSIIRRLLECLEYEGFQMPALSPDP